MISDKLKFYLNWCDKNGVESSLNGYLSFCESVKKIEEKHALKEG